ncbi:MAG: TIGR01777 family protein [Nitrospirae bacterium]|nr:TIGR01777 family protein [Nitrospirota bacterium]
MNILIIGGTGFIGSALSRELRNSGHTVVVTTRQKTNPPCPPLDKGGQGGVMTWNPPGLIPPDVISKFHAVINLAGEQIAPGRWTADKKQRILSSRVVTTHALVESIKQIPLNPPLLTGETSKIPLFGKEGEGEILKKDRGGLPRVLINASAVGYYGARSDELITEDSPPGSDFLAGVCLKWEAEALAARAYGVRVVITRFGAVLEADGGMLPHIVIPFKLSFGGPIGSGKQWFSWIHRDDVVGIIKFALEHEEISGPVNATAPNPVTNKEFTLALGKTLNKPTYFAVPAFMVEFTLGEFGHVLLTGQRVLPEKILKTGYRFKYTDINETLKAIYKKTGSK